MTADLSAMSFEEAMAELAQLANRYAAGLHELGLRTGDVLVSMVHNCAEAIAIYFAAYQSGLYIVAVNWHLTGPEVAYILGDSEASLVFTTASYLEPLSELHESLPRLERIVLTIDECEALCLADRLRKAGMTLAVQG